MCVRQPILCSATDGSDLLVLKAARSMTSMRVVASSIYDRHTSGLAGSGSNHAVTQKQQQQPPVWRQAGLPLADENEDTNETDGLIGNSSGVHSESHGHPVNEESPIKVGTFQMILGASRFNWSAVADALSVSLPFLCVMWLYQQSSGQDRRKCTTFQSFVLNPSMLRHANHLSVRARTSRAIYHIKHRRRRGSAGKRAL